MNQYKKSCYRENVEQRQKKQQYITKHHRVLTSDRGRRSTLLNVTKCGLQTEAEAVLYKPIQTKR